MTQAYELTREEIKILYQGIEDTYALEDIRKGLNIIPWKEMTDKQRRVREELRHKLKNTVSRFESCLK